MKAIRQLKSTIQFPFRLTAGILLILVLAALGLGMWDYAQEFESIREAEQTCAITSQLQEVVETFEYLRRLGDGKVGEVRQELNLKLVGRQKNLAAALAAADEKTRAFILSRMAIIESQKQLHPLYFAIQSGPIPALSPQTVFGESAIK